MRAPRAGHRDFTPYTLLGLRRRWASYPSDVHERQSYQATIAYIGKLTGRSPVLDHTYVGTPVDSTMPGAWAERIARSKAGWFSEDHLRLGFGGPLAREISESRTIDEEVPIVNAVGIRTGQVGLHRAHRWADRPARSQALPRC